MPEAHRCRPPFAIILACVAISASIDANFSSRVGTIMLPSVSAFLPSSGANRNFDCRRNRMYVDNYRRLNLRTVSTRMSSGTDGGDDDSESRKNKNDDDDDDLTWRLDKVRLEEAETRRFLNRRPLKLSYAESRKFIRKNWDVATKEEFEDLVENGNLRTPYVSKRPEEYYGERGEWISWDHYLLGEDDDDEHDANGRDGTEEGGRVLKWQ